MPTYYVGIDLHTRIAAMRSSWPASARWCIRRYPSAAHLLEGGMGLMYIRDSVAGCRVSKIALPAALVAGRSSVPGNRSQE